MDKGVASYFNKAFILINRSWSLFAFYLILSLLYSFPEFIANSFIKSLLSVVGFFIIILQIGFSFSLPLFLIDRQQGEPVTFKSLLLISLKSTKRLILPLILFFIIFIVVFIIGFVLAAQFIYIYGGDFYFETKIQGFNLWNLFFALIIGLFSFLTFAPIYFSLEKDRLLSSIKKSFALSFKHLNFIIILIILNALFYLIFSTFLNTNQNIYHSLISNIIYAYLDLIIGAASLYLYQKQKA